MISVSFPSLPKPVLPAAGSWHSARAAGYREARKAHEPPCPHAKPAPGLLPEPEVSPDLGSKLFPGLRGAPCLRSCREERRDGEGEVSPGSAPTKQLHRPPQTPGRTAGNERAGTGMGRELLCSGAFRAWMETATHRCAAWVAKADRGEGCIYQCNSPVVGTN